MTGIIPLLITLLGQILPSIGGSSAIITTIIQTLIQIIPVLVQEYKDLAPQVKDIIAVLQGSDAITPDQMAQLDTLNAQVDAAFDAAADAATAEDAKP